MSTLQATPAPQPAGAPRPQPGDRMDPLGPTIVLLAIALGLAYLAAYTGADITKPTSPATLAIGGPALAACALIALRHPAITTVAAVGAMAFSGAAAARWSLPIEGVITILLAGLVLATGIAYAFVERARTFFVAPSAVVVGAFVLLCASQIPFAESTTVGTRAFMAGPAYLLLIIGLAYAPWEPETRWRVVKGLIGVALAAGIYALIQEVSGPSTAEVSHARRSSGVGGDLALFGSLPNRVELGSWCAIAVPFLTAMALAATGRWRAIAATALGLSVLALLGSQVRTALVAAGVGIGVVLALLVLARSFGIARLGTAVLAAGGLLVAGTIGYAVTVADTQEKSERFSRILDPGSDFSFQQRVQKWEQALDEINAEPLGQGLGTAGSTQRNYSRFLRLDNAFVDNSWLEVGIQLGYPGLLMLSAAALALLLGIGRASLATLDPRAAATGIGAAAALTAWLVNMMTGGTYESWGAVLLWLLLGLALAPFVGRSSDRPSTAA